MRIFGYRIERTGNNGNTLTDDARAEGRAVRDMNAEKRRTAHEIEMAAMQLRLAKLHDQLAKYEDDDDGFDAEGLLSSLFLGGGVGQPPPSLEVSASLDDAAIEELLAKIPENYRKIGKNLPDGVLDAFLQKHTPYDAATRARAVALFRAKNL